MSIPVILLGKTGSDPFPCIDGLPQFYYEKNINTVFVSLGCSKSALTDLEIAEPLGCPIFITPIGGAAEWAELTRVLKTHKREPENSKYEFTKQAETKWILSKNLRFQEALPWWTTGEIDLSGEKIKTQSFFSWTKSICSTMKRNEDIRIDFIKIDLPAELERGVLLSMLDSGIRPSFIMVKWNNHPNTDIATSITAGHLQNCGYHLLGKYDNKFIYYYTDNDIYMLCNWDGTDVPNPIVKTIINKIKYSNARVEGSNVRNIPPPLAPIGETNTIIESETSESASSSVQ
jgi:hypothetical protein